MGKLKYDYPIVWLDVETNRADDKLFKDLGPLAVKEIRLVCVQLHRHLGAETESFVFEYSYQLRSFLTSINPATVVGHNIMRFDEPVLRRLWHIDLSQYTLVDTLIFSKLRYPMQKYHSLEAWGVTAGMHKMAMPDEDDPRSMWVDYCDNDVTICRYIFLEEIEGNQVVPEATMKLEHKFAQLFQEQVENGVKFDVFKATKLVHEFTFEMDKLEKDIVSSIGPVEIPESRLHYPPKVQFKRDGTPSQHIVNYCAKYGLRLMQGKDVHGGVFKPEVWLAVESDGTQHTKIKPLPFNEPWVTTEELDLNNMKQLKDKLLELGWNPTFWNMKDGIPTSPRLYDKDSGDVCPNLSKLQIDGLDPTDIKLWLTLRSRRNVLLGSKGDTGWLANSRLILDHKLGADADTVGAITGRVTHRTVANVPRITTPYGAELRRLFGPDDGFLQIGWDAQALEARMEAHYTHKYDGGAYAKLLMEGDVHDYNMRNLNLPNRDSAKTFKYAVTYGAQSPKLARTFGWTLAQAQNVYEKFWDANPALEKLRYDVIKQFRDKGFIVGLDGRHLYPRHEGAALNTLFQSAGAIVMKYAAVLAHKMIRRERLLAMPMIRYHDEEQWQTKLEYADRVGELGVLSIKYAGKYLKLNVELDGEYKIGNNWAECH